MTQLCGVIADIVTLLCSDERSLVWVWTLIGRVAATVAAVVHLSDRHDVSCQVELREDAQGVGSASTAAVAVGHVVSVGHARRCRDDDAQTGRGLVSAILRLNSRCAAGSPAVRLLFSRVSTRSRWNGVCPCTLWPLSRLWQWWLVISCWCFLVSVSGDRRRGVWPGKEPRPHRTHHRRWRRATRPANAARSRCRRCNFAVRRGGRGNYGCRCLHFKHTPDSNTKPFRSSI